MAARCDTTGSRESHEYLHVRMTGAILVTPSKSRTRFVDQFPHSLYPESNHGSLTFGIDPHRSMLAKD